MSKQKVSRVLAAFMTLALVVNAVSSIGHFEAVAPEAKAAFCSSPGPITGSIPGSGSSSIFWGHGAPASYRITSSNTSVIKLTSASDPAPGSYSVSDSEALKTHSGASPSFSTSFGFTRFGAGSATLTYEVLDGPTVLSTCSSSVSFTSAGPATISDLSPLSVGHNHSAPHTVPVTAKCFLNGASFVSMTVAASADVVGAPGSVSGSGSVERTLSFSVTNTTDAPYLATSIDITCTTSFGIVTRADLTFAFGDDAATAGPPSVSVLPHSHGAQFFTVTITDPNSGDAISSLATSSPGFAIFGATAGASPFLATISVDASSLGVARSYSLSFSSGNTLSSPHSLSGSGSGSVTITDVRATQDANLSGVLVPPVTGKSLDQLVKADLPDTTAFTVPTIVDDLDDAAALIVFTPQTIPGLAFSGSLFAGGGVLPNGSSYNITVTVTDNTLLSLPISVLPIATDAHGNTVLEVTPVPVGSTAAFTIGSGGGGRRTNNDPPVIEKLGDLDYTLKTNLDYKNPFGNDLKYSSDSDTYYTTQTRACWNVAVGADGKPIGDPVSTGTPSSAGMSTSGLGLKLDYNFGDFNRGLGYNDDSYNGLYEDMKFGDLKLSPMGLGFGLSLGGTYRSGWSTEDVAHEDDDDTETYTIPLTGFDWGIGLKYELGLGIGYTGNAEVDNYPEASRGDNYYKAGQIGIQF